MDSLAVAYSVIGSFSMGSYPMAVKAPAVLEAGVHPVVFQAYKSLWVFLTGWLWILANAIRGKDIIFAFTWWGVVEACFWIPCGICIIAAVPRLGLALDQAVNPGMSMVFSFLAGVFLVGQHIKLHGADGDGFILAPYYMAGVVAGVSGMVAAMHACKRVAVEVDEESVVAKKAEASSKRQLLSGLLLSGLGAFFSAMQFATMSFGKKAARSAHGGACVEDLSSCPSFLQEQFNSFGSYNASFGIGCALVTSLYYLGLVAFEKTQGRAVPSFHFQVMSKWGSVAGLLWAIGALFQRSAISKAGGPAFMQPLNLALQTIASGAWGILYYKEADTLLRILLWGLAVTFTLTSGILLSSERGS